MAGRISKNQTKHIKTLTRFSLCFQNKYYNKCDANRNAAANKEAFTYCDAVTIVCKVVNQESLKYARKKTYLLKGDTKKELDTQRRQRARSKRAPREGHRKPERKCVSERRSSRGIC